MSETQKAGELVEAVAWQHKLTGIVRTDKPYLGLHEDYTPLVTAATITALQDRVRELEGALSEAQAEIERFARERDEAQADAYRSSLEAASRLAEVDKANERANKNWRDFRDLRRSIIGDGPMCRDCADENGRCPHSDQPCDPDEAVKEKLAAWRAAEAALKDSTNG